MTKALITGRPARVMPLMKDFSILKPATSFETAEYPVGQVLMIRDLALFFVRDVALLEFGHFCGYRRYR